MMMVEQRIPAGLRMEKKSGEKTNMERFLFVCFFFSWEVGGYGRGLELEPPRREARQL